MVGLLADNGADWVAADLAAQQAGVVLVPLPAFFTETQIAHAVSSSGMDGLIGPAVPGFHSAGELAGLPFHRREAQAAQLPPGTTKIT